MPGYQWHTEARALPLVNPGPEKNIYSSSSRAKQNKMANPRTQSRFARSNALKPSESTPDNVNARSSSMELNINNGTNEILRLLRTIGQRGHSIHFSDYHVIRQVDYFRGCRYAQRFQNERHYFFESSPLK